MNNDTKKLLPLIFEFTSQDTNYKTYLSCYEQYQLGKESYKSLGVKYDVSYETIRRWIARTHKYIQFSNKIIETLKED